ncbi:c-type cytochrome [Nannocystaceae bacterium ST9]
MQFKLDRFLFASTLVFAAACDGGDEGDDDVGDDAGMVEGRDYYEGEASAALGAEGNQARCSTCHSADGTLAGFSGESMQDIAFKSSYKGGEAPDLVSGVNACVTGWMGGTALAEGDPEFVALAEYLESISDPAATTPNALTPEVLANEAAYEAAYAGGDATAGAAKYAANCSVCHDAALEIGTTAAYPKATLANFTIGRIAQKVRTSGPPPSGSEDPSDSTSAPMPFFEPDELSADDLADIIAHLKGA